MAPYIPRELYHDRETRRLNKLAEEQGYECFSHMLYTLYIVQGLSIQAVQQTLQTPEWSLRKRFAQFGIPIRGKGGPNNVTLKITQELYEEVCRDGMTTVCERLGYDYSLFWYRVHEYEERELGYTTRTSTTTRSEIEARVRERKKQQ